MTILKIIILQSPSSKQLIKRLYRLKYTLSCPPLI